MEAALLLLLRDSKDDLSSMTLKQIRRKLESRMGMSAGNLDGKKEKERIKKIIIDFSNKPDPDEDSENRNSEFQVQVQQSLPKPHCPKLVAVKQQKKKSTTEESKSEDSSSSSESDENSDDSDHDGKKKTKRKKNIRKPKNAKRNRISKHKQDDENECGVESQLRILGSIHRASGLGPNIYKGLPPASSGIERVEALSNALKAAGVKFSSLIPTKQEISVAKAKKDKERELEGIDTSNIILSDTRTRRRARAAVKYAESDDDEVGKGDEQGEDQIDDEVDNDESDYNESE
uniref:DEK-C domain-containing protein n=1 Tax=Aplanochytrium stocchinoi TaxID=215587 RepID=A0A7S3UY63_9STRA|mmetsp:Transcript_12111/g.14135  ORF Transcript_12111/g.14135 Transcript_12111/m.14135 type:complete len:290 (-) Transcript_12111:93-962(-)